MKIGDLRHRISFEREVKVADGYLGSTATWRSVATVWASVEPLSGREYFYGHQISTEVSHRIKIRYNETVDVKMRINFGGRYMQIASILDIKERHQSQEILAQEVPE